MDNLSVPQPVILDRFTILAKKKFSLFDALQSYGKTAQKKLNVRKKSNLLY